ncbi:hypothetical protein RJ641_021843 [Dillenia turbinata]|uniref:Uncharacterized protein n=1 Tax=Dillenia turbinata TaxID=194707 RepID=A0AAN8YVP6_9MAGN
MGIKYSTRWCVPLLVLLMATFALNFREAAGFTTSSSAFVTPFSSATLLQNENVSRPMVNSSDDTVRVDPLNDFKKYRGGYDITNKHYWSSTLFTGIYGYAIGVIWVLCGILFGVYLLAITWCCKSERKRKLLKSLPCHGHCYLWPIILAFTFTILAIVSSGVVLGGNARFYSRANTVVEIIIDTANDASKTIYSTTDAMQDITNILEASASGGGNASEFLNSTTDELDSQAADIEDQSRINKRRINLGLRTFYAVTTVIVSLNLIALIALTACGFLKLRRALPWLITLCWSLAFFCWFIFGAYIFIENFSGDTCTALKGFQENPYNNSLSSILPCDELLTAKPVLFTVSEGIYNLINQVNSDVLQQMYPDLVICNPFSTPPEYEYQPENCPPNTTQIGDIPQVIKALICYDSDGGSCEGESSGVYEMVESYTTSIQNFLNAYPGAENLIECQSVKDAFSEILQKHCKPLKRDVRMVWAAMLVLSMITVCLVLIWTTITIHERKDHVPDGSVKPHSPTAYALETGASKADNAYSIQLSRQFFVDGGTSSCFLPPPTIKPVVADAAAYFMNSVG